MRKQESRIHDRGARRNTAGEHLSSRPPSAGPIDPITLAVVQNGLQQVVNEADLALEQTAFSPVISEARDRANGIYDAVTGEVIAQGETGFPIFVGSMQFSVQSVLRLRKDLGPGDVILMNDPYLGGTHAMDLKLVKPYYYHDDLVCYVANTAHWTDVGGRIPGGFSATSTDILHEGLRITPVKLIDRGELNNDVLQIVLDNIRLPQEGLGNLRAQIAALNVLSARLTALVDKHGLDTVRACVHELRARSETLMRARVQSIPDGIYSFEDTMDSDGVEDRPLVIHVDLTVEGSNATFDFGKSSPPCRGPLNSVLSVTTSAVYIALMHCFREIPINSGCFKPISVVAPETTFLNARYPRPVAGCSSEVSQRIIDVAIGAVARAIPERLFGDAFGSVYNLCIAGVDPEVQRFYLLYNFGGGGYGGNPETDGLSNASSAVGISKLAPIEVLEGRYPVLFELYGLRERSAGAGRRRGGFGTDYVIRLRRGEAEFSLLGDRGKSSPFGVAGGLPAASGEVTVIRDGREERLPHLTKADGVRLRQGDGVRIQSPGGGGYGDPLQREPWLVARDVERAYITIEDARAEYGVVVRPDFRVDKAATESLRQTRRVQSAER